MARRIGVCIWRAARYCVALHIKYASDGVIVPVRAVENSAIFLVALQEL